MKSYTSINFIFTAIILVFMHVSVNADGVSPSEERAPNTVKINELPLNKRYNDLSDAEKKAVRDMYENIPDTDEPPFPANGLKNIYTRVQNLQAALQKNGYLSLDVMIDEDGDPLSIKIYNSPDDEMAAVVGAVLMHSKYKPGKCKGVPCKMAYRFDFNFGVIQKEIAQ